MPAFCLALAGCGGSKVIKQSVDFTPPPPLAHAADASLDVTLAWVIVRNGPGSWATNADWDEYLLAVRNHSGDTLNITAVSIYDSLDTMITSDHDRNRLVGASRETARRYKGRGIEVKAGVSGERMVKVGTVGTAAAYGAATTILASGSTAAATSAVAAGALGGLLLGPALVVGGVVKSSNNRAVAREIEWRHTELPVDIAAGDDLVLTLFFALGPSPQRVELTYVDGSGEHVLSIDTRDALHGLHIGQ